MVTPAGRGPRISKLVLAMLFPPTPPTQVSVPFFLMACARAQGVIVHRTRNPGPLSSDQYSIFAEANIPFPSPDYPAEANPSPLSSASSPIYARLQAR